MHIDNYDLKKFQSDTMNTEDMIAFLEHIDQCDYCLEQLMENEAHNTQSIAPAYMKETIMQRALAPDVQVQKATLETTNKMKLFYDGLRTVVGVALALIMLFSLGQAELFSPQVPQSSAQTTAARQDAKNSFHIFSSSITDGLSDGSQKIVDCINSISSTISNGGN